MKTILVIDGNSIINRSFYGIRTLTTQDGRHTNAIYGLLTTVSRHLETCRPDYAAVAFDRKEPTFRHELYHDYKAGRRPTPPELLSQFPDAKACLTAMGITVLEQPGYEADDLQGTIAHLADTLPDTHCYILSGDRDLLQLITDSVTVLLATNKDTLVMDRDAFFAQYGIEPQQLVDAKALMGDSSDNIPGVPGIGEKTALQLIADFGSLDGVYEHLDDSRIKKGVRAKLEAGRDSAVLSRKLAAICTDAPLPVPLSDMNYRGFDVPVLRERLINLEFTNLIRKMGLDREQPEATSPAAESQPVPCFTQADAALLSRQCTAGFSVQVLPDGWYFSCADGNYVYREDPSELAPLFSDADRKIICYDAKALWHLLRRHGITPAPVMRDLMLYAYVCNAAAGQPSLSGLLMRQTGQLLPDGAPGVHLFAGAEASLRDQIEQMGSLPLLEQIELPLAPVLAEMEERGVRIDREGMLAYADQLDRAAADCAESVYEMAGHVFNLNSPKQLAQVLYEELQLPAPRKTRSGYSTDAETLEKLRYLHPAVDQILEYRQLTKLSGTYARGLPALTDENNRLHTDFKQALTATGRLSSAEPNLQNIPIRTPLGRQMRNYFVTDPGYVLVDADYSQIELRLLAHLSQDPVMCEAFRQEQDIHRRTAAQVFGIPEEEVTPEQRKRAKAINFGIIYGIGAYSLSGDLGISVAQAKRYIEQYLGEFPKVGAFLEETVAHAEADGYTTTLFGRRRNIPELHASKAPLRAFGKRVAMNSPLQGSAADIMKIAMLHVRRRLSQSWPDAHLVMQVHDELLVEAPAAQAEEVAAAVKEEMESAASLLVPLTVDVSIASTWLK